MVQFNGAVKDTPKNKIPAGPKRWLKSMGAKSSYDYEHYHEYIWGKFWRQHKLVESHKNEVMSNLLLNCCENLVPGTVYAGGGGGSSYTIDSKTGLFGKDWVHGGWAYIHLDGLTNLTDGPTICTLRITVINEKYMGISAYVGKHGQVCMYYNPMALVKNRKNVFKQIIEKALNIHYVSNKLIESYKEC